MIDASRLNLFVTTNPNGPDLALAPQAAEPVDRFAPLQPAESMSVGRLRQAVAAFQVRSTTDVAIDKIPFGIEIEMENIRPNQMEASLKALGEWEDMGGPRSWQSVRDGSLNDGAEFVSPVMTLESGEARRQITEVLSQAKTLGATVSANCGLHIHVKAAMLGRHGLTNLMRMALEQENALYHLAQNGQRLHRGMLMGKGYRDGMPFRFARPMGNVVADPFPILHADDPIEFRNSLYKSVQHGSSNPPDNPALPFTADRRHPMRYFGINFNSVWYRGTVEFRLFNATDDPELVLADIQLVLGMMKAAAEGTYVYLRPQAIEVVDPNRPVSRQSLEHFLQCVAPQPAMQERLLTSFRQSGGKTYDDTPVTDPVILSTLALQQAGYCFYGDGKFISSPFEIQREMELGRRPVQAIHPQSLAPVAVDKLEDLEALQKTAVVPPCLESEEGARLQRAVDALRGRDFAIWLPLKTPISIGEGQKPLERLPLVNAGQAGAALRTDGLLIVPPGSNDRESIKVSTLAELERYVAIECSPDLEALDTQAHTVLEQVERLKTSGYPIAYFDTDPLQTHTLHTRTGVLSAVLDGKACVPLTDSGRIRRTLESPADLEQAYHVLQGNMEAVDTDAQQSLQLMEQLAGLGFEWRARGQATGQLNRLGLLESLRAGLLQARYPRKMWSPKVIPVPTMEALRKLGDANIHTIPAVRHD